MVLIQPGLNLLETRLLAVQRTAHGQQHSSWKAAYDGPPLADDWLVDEQGYGLGVDDVEAEPRRNRHFSGRLNDLDLLRKRLS
ncbi:unnamed protein product [Dibothriocephalus latus]|uniref:Uncharacterized protein n=1 Tax=Dibothriocephalus latus TaxID=60516 RepID=A0A3P6PCP9_DIBLA|nr:unnamed protein product [Dibothriocephalus latus]